MGKYTNKTKEFIVEHRSEGKLAEAGFDCYPMGKDSRTHFNTDSRTTGCNNSHLIVGGSGSGKTESIVKPMIHSTCNGNLVLVCTKKEIIGYAADDLKKKGYRCLMLNFVQPEKTKYGYDPLRHCRNESDVRDLAHSIMLSTNHTGESRDPYWENSAESMLALVFDVVFSGACPKGRSMDIAMELLDTLRYESKCEWLVYECDEPEEKAKKLECYPLHNLLEEVCKNKSRWNAVWHSFRNLSEVTGSCVVSSTQEPINKIFTEEIRYLMKYKPEFDFSELLQPKTAVIVYVSPVNKSNHAFVSIVYQQLFKVLFEKAEQRKDGKLPYPVQIICDDFATGCKVPDFHELISIFREKRIGVTLLIQSESQLDAMYGVQNATTIINNCDTYVYMGGMDIKTCESISKRMNIPCIEVLNMPIGKEYVFRRGQMPIWTERYSLNKDCKPNNITR